MGTRVVNGVRETVPTAEMTTIQAEWTAEDAQSLDRQRATATVSRSEFFTGAWTQGVLTEAEAIAAGRGEMPASFDLALAAAVTAGTLTAAEASAAKILAASAQTFERNNSNIALMQSYLTLTDAQVDTIFGIS